MFNMFKKKDECFITLEQAKNSFKTRYDDDNFSYFNVAGSSQITVSNFPSWSTGSVKDGISIGLSCLPGGVISKQEAIKLANHLLKVANSE